MALQGGYQSFSVVTKAAERGLIWTKRNAATGAILFTRELPGDIPSGGTFNPAGGFLTPATVFGYELDPVSGQESVFWVGRKAYGSRYGVLCADMTSSTATTEIPSSSSLHMIVTHSPPSSSPNSPQMGVH